jgi:hypothetical protein
MLVLAVVTRCVVFLHTGGDVSALAGGDAVVFGPGPDIAGALTAGQGPSLPTVLCPPALAGVLDEGREVLAERGAPASPFTGW